MPFQLGLEVFLNDQKQINALKKKRVGLVCHPASVDKKLNHSFDVIHRKIGLSSAFGPQHGVKGEKQDNMIESETFIHPEYKIPIYSLYGEVRRPTEEMMNSCDVIIFDLQDLGCRIYTFITTLLYVMEECARLEKTCIVLDRPNPAGRVVEGFSLEVGYESFVGAAAFPMRHGLTTAEMALFYQDYFKLELDLQIYKMKNYKPNQKMGFGWPADRAWVNPSPNAATLNMARAYPGTVLIEGTTLSEGRGTTRALEQIGASDLDFTLILNEMKKMAPRWLEGGLIRECYFEPTFHKHEKKLCHGFQFHTDDSEYRPQNFKPFRVVALMLKVIRKLYPTYEIYRDFAYEYTTGQMAFDVINGGPKLRAWIENPKLTPADLEKSLVRDEKNWVKTQKKYLLYK